MSPTLQVRDEKVNLYIEKDRHRPKPPIPQGKYFLIITENQQPTERPSFINVKNDAVYKLAKSRKSASNKLHELFKLCKSLSGLALDHRLLRVSCVCFQGAASVKLMSGKHLAVFVAFCFSYECRLVNGFRSFYVD
ncbi:hypothetical protein DPMN_093336 [Dreissena polymorpha]|uniref:Uncharacterized protein n=1 Tax=Dreissena polymorpha TaxID=45954 RepID=A0A9D4R0T0_DREPO|nr:hypothetical protein DPMN_093336 [Dreissena polymorpha]